MPLSSVARAMALAGSQWKLSGGHSSTSSRRPYSESTPQAVCVACPPSICAHDSMSEAVRRRVVVRGNVQGVFFRDSCRREASSRGVAGWVTNRPDGAVEAVFEGEPDAVGALVDFCREGPSSADVDSVDQTSEEPEGLSSFEV